MQQIRLEFTNAEQVLEQLLNLSGIPKAKSNRDQNANNIAIAQLENFYCYAEIDDDIIIYLPGAAGIRRAVIIKESSNTYTGYFVGFESDIEFSIDTGRSSH